MKSKIDRIGEKNINSFGSEIIIVGYRNTHDIDVYFPQYDWITKNKDYSAFKKGKISQKLYNALYNYEVEITD